MKRISILVFLLFSLSSVMAQEESQEVDKFYGFELTASTVYSYNTYEQEGVFATEIHPCFWIPETKWGLGIALGTKFYNDATLVDVAILNSYIAYKWLTINSGLNIGLANEKRREETEFGFYFEGEWNYELTERFHLGLVTGTVISEKSELNVGLQMGLKF